MKKRSLLSWLAEFVGRRTRYYGGSVALAIWGVAASLVPYFLIAGMVG